MSLESQPAHPPFLNVLFKMVHMFLREEKSVRKINEEYWCLHKGQIDQTYLRLHGTPFPSEEFIQQLVGAATPTMTISKPSSHDVNTDNIISDRRKILGTGLYMVRQIHIKEDEIVQFPIFKTYYIHEQFVKDLVLCSKDSLWTNNIFEKEDDF